MTNFDELHCSGNITNFLASLQLSGIGGGALYAVYAKAYTVFLCVC